MALWLGWRALALFAAYPVSMASATEPEALRDLYARTLRAHVGLGVGFDHDPVVLLRYTRRRPGDPDREHVYLRRGADRYVEVKAQDRVVLRLAVNGGSAWALDVRAPLDPVHVRAQADRLGTAALGPIGRLPQGSAAFDALREVELGVHGLRQVAFPGHGGGPALRLSLDPDTGRIVRAEVGAGATSIQWRYDGWQVLGDGRAVPRRVTIERAGSVVDTIEVHAFDPSPVVPEAWLLRLPSSD